MGFSATVSEEDAVRGLFAIGALDVSTRALSNLLILLGFFLRKVE